jgi:hypothetical protein
VALNKSHKSQKSGSEVPGKPRATALVKQGSAASSQGDSPTDDKEVRDTGIIEAEPAKQWWKRDPDSKQRKQAMKIVVHREAGRDDKWIAKHMKTTEANVRQVMYLARKNGWLDANDEPVDIEAELALTIDRKVVRNIDAVLDGKMTNWQTHEMTMAAAKGRGIFKNHEVSKQDISGSMQSIVAIQVVMPAIGSGDQAVEIPEHMVGGVPAYLEGEVSDGATDTAATE